MRLVLDTSVIVEYVVLGSTYRPKVVKLFELASKGGVELYVNPVTLSEVLYVVSRIYQAAGVEDPNGEALDYVEWVKRRARGHWAPAGWGLGLSAWPPSCWGARPTPRPRAGPRHAAWRAGSGAWGLA